MPRLGQWGGGCPLAFVPTFSVHPPTPLLQTTAVSAHFFRRAEQMYAPISIRTTPRGCFAPAASAFTTPMASRRTRTASMGAVRAAIGKLFIVTEPGAAPRYIQTQQYQVCAVGKRRRGTRGLMSERMKLSPGEPIIDALHAYTENPCFKVYPSKVVLCCLVRRMLPVQTRLAIGRTSAARVLASSSPMAQRTQPLLIFFVVHQLLFRYVRCCRVSSSAYFCILLAF